jgi:molybdenum cofactor cytidylyltransferase
MANENAGPLIALLLASGRGARFDPSGQQNKLVQRLPDGHSVIARSAYRLIEAGLAVTVVAPADERLFKALDGAPVSWCNNEAPEQGMGHSIALGVKASPFAAGWIIALADMPFILASTIARVASALGSSSAPIVAPYFDNQRGHPVAFAASMRDRLGALRGDQGARAILASELIYRVDTDDYGILRDIDRPQDLTA